MVKRRTERIQIAAWIGAAEIAPDLFQRGVRRRPPTLHHGNRTLLVGGHGLHEAKIHQLDHAIRRELHVRRFDITVQHRRDPAVQITQRVGKLVGPVEHLIFRQRPPLPDGLIDHLAQIDPRHEIHNQEIAVILRKEIGDFGQIRVIQPGEDTGLALELAAIPFALVRGSIHARADLLHRGETPIQPLVGRLIHPAHAALADHLDNFVAAAEHIAGLEGIHRWGYTPIKRLAISG